MDTSGWNMYVFRDGRRSVRGGSLKERLIAGIERVGTDSSEDNLLAALITAGELECALEDCGCSAAVAGNVTDSLAKAFVTKSVPDCTGLIESVRSLEVPATLSLSVAEGFAYYALHPRRLAETVAQLAGTPVRVVGIRSIGVTLSAVVVALLRRLGTRAERITVRPTGHPYDRKLRLSEAHSRWVCAASPETRFVIVDEGPGLSGSSFLAVSEALESANIPAERIVMMGSRVPEAEQLRAPDAISRWPRYKFCAASPRPVLPDDAGANYGGGLWRREILTDFEHQPASWTQLEPAKYLSGDGQWLYKFHGYGHFGEEIASRATRIAERCFGPDYAGLVRGFGRYRIVAGKILSASDISAEVVLRMAEYCAFRRSEFSFAGEQTPDLDAMVGWNWECEFKRPLLRRLCLKTEKPIIADARMLPQEWLRTEDGRLLKLDGTTHGDDHFFPGPCDIAWDLAGAIVEWEMNEQAADEFLGSYEGLSGDDARMRLPDYLFAYSVFRMAWSKMAAKASAGSFDEGLLLRDYQRYRQHALRHSRLEVEASKSIAEESAGGLEPAVA